MKIRRHLLIYTFILFSFSLNALPKILGVGQAIYDVIYECESDAELSSIIEGSGISKSQCGVIDDEKASILRERLSDKKPIKESAGGSIANTLVGLAKLGAHIDFFYSVAKDEHGASFTADIKALDFNIFPTLVDVGATGLSHALVTRHDGERTMLTQVGVSSQTRIDDLTDAMMLDYDMVLSEGFMLYNPHTAMVAKEVLRRARNAGKKTVFTLSSPDVARRYKTSLNEILSNVTMLFGSEKEYFAYCDADDLDAVATCMNNIADVVVVTRGIEGAFVMSKGEQYSVPVRERVLKPVDTTGAGDAFVAGFIHGSFNNSLVDAARMGNAAAYEIIGQLGARPGKDFTSEKIRAHSGVN